MSSFTRATFKDTGKRRFGRPIYRIVGGFRFHVGFVGSTLFVDVPDGFETDGASVPSWMMKVLPVHRMIKSAALHDRLREDLRFGKADGDAIFLSAMYAERVPVWLREIAFAVVRINRSRARAA